MQLTKDDKRIIDDLIEIDKEIPDLREIDMENKILFLSRWASSLFPTNKRSSIYEYVKLKIKGIINV